MFLGTASRIAWRELRVSPGKFLFVIFAVAVGVAALSGVKGFGYAFKGMLSRNAKQLIASDLQAQVYQQPPPDEIAKMTALSNRFGVMTRVTETESMAASTKEGIPQMISIKAVDPAHFPFYGDLVVSPAQPLAKLLGDDASVVVTPELLMRLRVSPGETIRLGGKDYRITGTLITEPDRLASGFRPGMRVLMSREGLERSGLIQYGSRAAERFLFKLKPGVDLDAAKADIKSTLHRVFITDYKDGSPIVGKAIDATTTFLSLISLIALIVGALGVAMAMYSHLQQRMDTIAVMKAMGARAHQVIQIYMVQTLWLGIAGGLIGVAIGAIVQKSFPWLIQRVFALLPDVPWDWSFSLPGLEFGSIGHTAVHTATAAFHSQHKTELGAAARYERCRAGEPQTLEGEDCRLAGRFVHLSGILSDYGLAKWIVENESLFRGGFKRESAPTAGRCRPAPVCFADFGEKVASGPTTRAQAWFCKFVPARESSSLSAGRAGHWRHVHACDLSVAAHCSARGEQ